MKRHLAVILACLGLLAAQARADDAPAIPAAQIAKVVRTYAGTIGCLMALDKRNIVAYKVGNSPVYVALYGIDPECSGGSAMYHTALAVLEEGGLPSNAIFMRPELSFPIQWPQGVPQYTDRLFVKDGKLMFRGKDFGPGDPLCCPTVPVTGVLSLKDGKWVVQGVKTGKARR